MAIENGILQPSGGVQLRGGTAADLASVNPVVKPREIMVEADTGKIKVGFHNWRNGVDYPTNWSDLSYIGGGWLNDEVEAIESTIDYSVLHNSFVANNYISIENALAAISSGSFTNMWVGTGIGNIRSGYRVLDFNYFYGIGNCLTPHVVVARYGAFNNTSSAPDGFSSGGYYGLTGVRSMLSSMTSEAVSSFGDEHVLTHSEYLCDGISNGEASSYDWYSSRCELMTLHQVYGGLFFGSSELSNLSGYKQFSYFRLMRGLGNVTPGLLRDVASANSLWAASSITPSKVTLEADGWTSATPYICIC